MHFKEDDYERDLKNELLQLPTVKRLKATAIPTLNLTVEHGTQNTKSTAQKRKNDQEREERMAKRARKELVSTILASSEKLEEEIVLKTDAETQVSFNEGKWD